MSFRRLAALCAAAALFAPMSASAGSFGPARAANAAGVAHGLSAQQMKTIEALRQRVKYVFVIYQENRSFDSYFGTFPGADGLFSRPAAQTPGFTQYYKDTQGNAIPITPFRIGPSQIAADTDDVDHSHQRLIAKMDVTANGPQMDQFALIEEAKHYSSGNPTLQAKQYGELAMAYEDCDTIPLYWNYANRFVLFDHVFQREIGPSTPGNIAIISAQSGETQYGLHPSEGYTDNGSGTVAGVPVENDRDPAWGPFNPGDGANPSNEQLNLTFATLPLTLAGSSVTSLPASDPNASTDFADLGADLTQIAKEKISPLGWGWYQEGYDQEPTYPQGQNLNYYITHHNGPQYFGYLTNSAENANFHGLGDFDKAVHDGTLPASGGVFYVKGGFQNILKLHPANPLPAVQSRFNGDDDHPGYSDAQISEANVAQLVNQIAKSQYWAQSAIVVTWDDSEGDYDHVPPPLTEIGPGVGNSPQDFVSDGPRVPLIVISPFANTGTVVHDSGDQSSVVKFVDTLFGLKPLGTLPDEQLGAGGAAALGHVNFLPDDASGITDLLKAFDPDRLSGKKAPLPASYAEVPNRYIFELPQQTGFGCKSLGIVPVDYQKHIVNNIPSDFNPLPGTNPTQAKAHRIDARAEVMREKDPED